MWVIAIHRTQLQGLPPSNVQRTTFEVNVCFHTAPSASESPQLSNYYSMKPARQILHIYIYIYIYIWVVVKIMVPFWVPYILGAVL